MSSDFLSENNFFDLLVISNTLMSKYDEWRDNVDIISALNSDTNIFGFKLKEFYNNVDDKVVNSINLAFLIYLYINITNSMSIYSLSNE
jgi:hypothetical protein